MTTTTDSRDLLVGTAYEAGRLPGILAGTFRAGQVDWRCSRGDTGTAYRIASITKTFTAVAVLQLRDEGVLDLDDQLGTHVPDAPYADHTIGRLLAHSSGMTAEPVGPWWERVPGCSWDDLVSRNAETVDVFGAGQRYHYSNLGYALLGELVARRRGGSWWEAVRDRVLGPVGLAGTTFDAPAGAAIGTSRDPRSDRLVREAVEDEGAMAPAGQLWSTVGDLARWADVLVTGQPGVLAADTAVTMRTVQSADPDLQHRGAYGLGLRLRWTPTSTLLGHTGSLPGFLAGVFVDPATRVGAVVLTNATTGLDPEGLCASLIGAVEPNNAVAPPPADPSSPAADLAGTWYWGNTGIELVATAEGLALVKGEDVARFRSEAADHFLGLNRYYAGERLSVHRDADGTARYLEVVTFILTRTPYDQAAPVPGKPPVPYESSS